LKVVIFRCSQQNPVCISLPSHSCHIPRPSYSPWIRHS
jgi:hypothetical protein